jgi:hypothetical protein
MCSCPARGRKGPKRKIIAHRPRTIGATRRQYVAILEECRGRGMLLRGAMERGEFVETIMKMREEDLMTYALSSMQLLGMYEWAGQRIVAMAESDSQSRQWLSWWAQRHNLQLRHLEPLETLRMDFATSAVIKRWFLEMVGLVKSVPMQLRMIADEVMLTITRSSKWVVGLGQQVFARKTNQLPHFTVMASFNPEGAGPSDDCSDFGDSQAGLYGFSG